MKEGLQHGCVCACLSILHILIPLACTSRGITRFCAINPLYFLSSGAALKDWNKDETIKTILLRCDARFLICIFASAKRDCHARKASCAIDMSVCSSCNMEAAMHLSYSSFSFLSGHAVLPLRAVWWSIPTQMACLHRCQMLWTRAHKLQGLRACALTILSPIAAHNIRKTNNKQTSSLLRDIMQSTQSCFPY